METSLYEKYGGFSTISQVVHDFYDKVLASDLLEPYFKDIDMQRLMDHQTIFLSSILGGPLEYTGRVLKTAHQDLNITEEAFEEVAELLQETLEDASVEPKDIQTIMNIVAGTKKDIVTA